MDAHQFAEIFYRHKALGWPHTLDSPIRYEVWRDFARFPDRRVDLLLQVQINSDFLGPLTELLAAAGDDATSSRPALVGDIAAVEVPFNLFFDVIVPQTDWQDLIETGRGLEHRALAEQLGAALRYEQQGVIDPGTDPPLPSAPDTPRPKRDLVERFRWFILLVARLGYLAPADRDLHEFATGPRSGAIRYLHDRFENATSSDSRVAVLAVSLNRPATVAIMDSRATVKADAVSRLFDIDCTPIGWAVLDSGIDATHFVFRKTQPDGKRYSQPFGVLPSGRVNLTRVEQTYDLRTAREFFVGRQADPGAVVSLDQRLLRYPRSDVRPRGLRAAHQRPRHACGRDPGGQLAR